MPRSKPKVRKEGKPIWVSVGFAQYIDDLSFKLPGLNSCFDTCDTLLKNYLKLQGQVKRRKKSR